MPIKKTQFIIRGMARDLAASKFNPELAFENKNIRLVATDDNTTGVITNELGNLIVDTGEFASGISGTPIGQAIIDNNLILFTRDDEALTNKDNIYKIKFNDSNLLVGEKLYSGDLSFSVEHPIEAISVYENDVIKKVYWTDGINQPRVINIEASSNTRTKWTTITDPFDFIRRIGSSASVNITRNLVSSGVFAPGTIQYMLAYCNRYGQESNIFYTSPLYYISYNNRGASAKDTVGVSFKIQINGVDKSYDKVRIYSIHRTSINATPQARIVADISTPTAAGNSTVIYTDYGTSGRTIDPTDLFYVGGQVTSISTMTQKDNVLFLGGISTNRFRTETRVMSIFKANDNTVITGGDAYKNLTVTAPSGHYTYTNQLKGSSYDFTTYKYGETYRFGLQFQDIWGNWSEPEWICDKVIDNYPQRYSDTQLRLPKPYFSYDESEKAEAYRIIPSLYNTYHYIKVRPVVVFPSITERTILCQGVLAPTVYNADDRFSHYPDIQSSWFFRPTVGSITNFTYGNSPSGYNANQGSGAEFRHNYPIPGNNKFNAEIQCISMPPVPFLGASNSTYTESSDPATWASENRECFYVDQSVATFHSPDIEFDKELRSIDSSNLKLRIVGYIPIQTSISDIDIQTSTPPLNYSKSTKESYPDVAPGFYKEKVSVEWGNSSYGWKSMLSGVFWLDELYGSERDNAAKGNVGFVVYPWHRNGSLNNTRTVKEDETKSAMLEKKKMSTLRYSARSVFLPTVWNALTSGDSYHNGISGVSIFDAEDNVTIRIPEPKYSKIGELVYKGNVDKVIAFHTKEKTSDQSKRGFDTDLDIDPKKSTSTSAFYPIIVASDTSPASSSLNNSEQNPPESGNFRRNNSHSLFTGTVYTGMREIYPTGSRTNYVSSGVQACSNDAVSMKYKSTPHAVLAFNYTIPSGSDDVGYQVLLPKLTTESARPAPESDSRKLFWDPNSSYDKIKGTYQDTIQIPTAYNDGYLWLAELYDDTNKTSSRFGGQTQEAFESNQWLVAGPAVSLVTYGTPVTSFTLNWTEGDTYYQRYDCLKTYPYTMEDQNSVVDILSFMCETRINIDGRYDRNRGQSSNLYANPANFNLLNTVYSQKDNFFTYRGMNRDKPLLNKFPNTITWSKTKTLGEETDTWTNMTLASTLDLDGDKGEVRALRRFNDSIISFQDTGISQILYNENVQISSTAGVPIEIANSGKVQGKRYISNIIGCTNKYSICTTPAGLYFVDNLTRDIYLFNGQFNNLSDKYGFHSWAVNNLSSIEPWNPSTFNNCVTYYDKVNDDVLFITKDTALAFSETAGQFTSFYDYGDTPYFANIKDRGIAIHKYTQTIEQEGEEPEEVTAYYPFLHREGVYNHFYGEYKPFWTTVVVNPNPVSDKIFNNLEFRADGFDNLGVYDKDYTFDTLDTWNEYQQGSSTLVNTLDKPSSLKKKFRIWRAQIPRNTTNRGGSESISYRRDRMRNPWLYLKLSMTDSTHLQANKKLILHDLVVDYFE